MLQAKPMRDFVSYLETHIENNETSFSLGRLTLVAFDEGMIQLDVSVMFYFHFLIFMSCQMEMFEI